MDIALFAAGLATLFSAHQVADHVLGQSDKIAQNKANPGRQGWYYIGQHVMNYHFVMVIMLLVTLAVLNIPVSFIGFALCIAFSVVSHGFIDRRWPVKWILDHTGSPEFAKMNMPLYGMYLADQGLHYACLWVSALLLTVG